jgi:hypothetical protein
MKTKHNYKRRFGNGPAIPSNTNVKPELWRASGRSAAKIGAELGIRAALLYRWERLECEPGR